MQPLVSFIILSYNRMDALPHAIESVRRQRYARKEIVVVDNGSTDGTIGLLEEDFPDVKIVSLARNLGPATGRNRGIEAAGGQIFVFLDDDCVLEGENATDLTVSQFQADPECGIVAYRILDPHTRQEWPYGLYAGRDEPAAFECIRFCSGGAAFRRLMLDEVGPFWEPFFIEHEDTELALRTVVSGWRIMGRTDIVTLHPAPNPAAPLNPRRAIYFRVRNSLWLAVLRMPVIAMPRYLLLTFARCLNLAVRTGRMAFFIRAIVDGIRGMSHCLRDRRAVSRAQIRRASALRMRLWT